jgi:hypothetical protein
MLSHNGKNYARVSEVISPFADFSGIDPEVLDRKARLGTQVHEIIKDDIDGKFPIVTPDSLGYFQSYEKWTENVRPVFLESETRYYDEAKMLTGCIDALVKLHGEEEAVLVDFKTSAQQSPITWPMQAHLYQHLLKVNGKPTAPRFLFLKLDKTGALPQVFQYKFDPNILRKCYQAIEDFWGKYNTCCE